MGFTLTLRADPVGRKLVPQSSSWLDKTPFVCCFLSLCHIPLPYLHLLNCLFASKPIWRLLIKYFNLIKRQESDWFTLILFKQRDKHFLKKAELWERGPTMDKLYYPSIYYVSLCKYMSVYCGKLWMRKVTWFEQSWQNPTQSDLPIR